MGFVSFSFNFAFLLAYWSLTSLVSPIWNRLLVTSLSFNEHNTYPTLYFENTTSTANFTFSNQSVLCILYSHGNKQRYLLTCTYLSFVWKLGQKCLHLVIVNVVIEWYLKGEEGWTKLKYKHIFIRKLKRKDYHRKIKLEIKFLLENEHRFLGMNLSWFQSSLFSPTNTPGMCSWSGDIWKIAGKTSQTELNQMW
jgi:hypothetical protein